MSRVEYFSWRRTEKENKKPNKSNIIKQANHRAQAGGDAPKREAFAKHEHMSIFACGH